MARVNRPRLRCGRCVRTLADVNCDRPGEPAYLRDYVDMHPTGPSWPYMHDSSWSNRVDDRGRTVDYRITCLKCRSAYVVTVSELTDACSELPESGRRNLALGHEVGKVVGAR